MSGMVPDDVFELTGVSDPRLSPDGTTVYIKNLNNLLVVDAATWTLRQTLSYSSDGASLHGIAVSPDGTHVAALDHRLLAHHQRLGAAQRPHFCREAGAGAEAEDEAHGREELETGEDTGHRWAPFTRRAGRTGNLRPVPVCRWAHGPTCGLGRTALHSAHTHAGPRPCGRGPACLHFSTASRAPAARG